MTYQLILVIVQVLVLAGISLFFLVGIRRGKTKQVRDALWAILVGFGCPSVVQLLG